MRACVRACVKIGMEIVMLVVEGTIPALTIGMGGIMARSAMLAPALLLTGSAVPVVAIRAVVGCARGDGFLCVWAEEL
jgi:hypothetical protein